MQALIEREFPQEPELVYLNHAAVSPWPRRTAAAIKEFADENVNTGAEHYKLWSAKEDSLREQLRMLINAPSTADIALLKNTSEAISVVADGLRWQAGDNIVTTNEEFPSNRIPWEAQKDKGVGLKEVAVQVEEPENALIEACDDKTRLMTVSSVQYGSGLRLNLKKLGEFCSASNILYCVDAIQSIGAYRFDVQRIHADFAMADAHKWMLGPEGIAVFYCRESVREQLDLHQYGWHMVEHAGDYDRKKWQIARTSKRFECGTPNMLGTFALSASLSLIEELGIDFIEEQIIEKSEYLLEGLQKLSGAEILTKQGKSERSGIVTFRIQGQDSKSLHTSLMRKRVICANRFGGIRFPPHFYTPRQKLDQALNILAALEQEKT
ncbi:MAG: aminotransferase class V-fold PLP-dependent enzyme [Gammaproteobacteria bacterium]|nr:aminotransferase class V-fold PLP-dependent enzyme [Gammaproteobacteria bacterium]